MTIIDDYCATQQAEPEELTARLKALAERFEAEGFMLLECQQLDSSHLGQRTILPYGGMATFKQPPTHPVSPRGLASDMSVVVGTITREELEAL